MMNANFFKAMLQKLSEELSHPAACTKCKSTKRIIIRHCDAFKDQRG